MSTFCSLSFNLLLLGLQWLIFSPCVNGKGAATRGAAAGGGAGVTAGEGGSGNYTEKEMQAALVILALVLILFFSVCACQCYQKVIWEMSISWKKGDGKKPMPAAPYTRDASSI